MRSYLEELSQAKAKMAEKKAGAVGGAKKGERMSQEKIVATFQQLRMEQHAIVAKINEMDAEKNEHNIVIEALKKVDPGRKCFRMIGGVLVERTVKDVLPALNHNCEQLGKLVEKLKDQLAEKGKELNAFKLQHNIRFHEEGDPEKPSAASSDSKPDSSMQGVLIS